MSGEERGRPPSYSSVGGLCVRPGPQAPGVLRAHGSGPRMGTAAPLVSGAWADSRRWRCVQEPEAVAACLPAPLSLRLQARQAQETPVPCPLPWVFRGHSPREECTPSPAQPHPGRPSPANPSLERIPIRRRGPGWGRQAPPGSEEWELLKSPLGKC